MESNHYKCAIVGDWHLAFVTFAGLAHLGHRSILLNPAINNWEQLPTLNLSEPNLNKDIKKFYEQGLVNYSKLSNENWTTDFLWLAIDTPVNEFDESDLSSLSEVLSFDFKGRVKKGIIVTSQVPLGFCSKYKNTYNIAYVPENLRLGQGLETFLNSDRIVIGSDNLNFLKEVDELLKGIKGERFLCNLNTSEMIKHATNSFLASSISLANQLALIGEQYNVDNIVVGKALKSDSRIGKRAYVIPGKGFAGGTLPRDLKTLQLLGKSAEVKTPLIDSILEVNDFTYDVISKYLVTFFKNLEGKQILLLGYSYKPDIDTLRRSPAIELAKKLKKLGANVLGFDPVMNKKDLTSLDGLITHVEEIKKLTTMPDAIVVMLARDVFKKINWDEFLNLNKNEIKNPLIFDTESMLDSVAMIRQGFEYKAMWQPLVSTMEK
jgi:UDPglucose 6-dehydrogenase